MRNHDSSESLVILASASDLLLRATDGMLVDGEACTLPQLEVECYNSRFSLNFQVLFISDKVKLGSVSLTTKKLSHFSHIIVVFLLSYDSQLT